MEKRTCRKCLAVKQIGQFRVSKPGYRRRVCSECMDAAAVAWQETNRERSLAWNKEYYAKNREQQIARALAWNEANKSRKKESAASWYKRKRMECIEAYGARCACCDESEVTFLVLDHVNDDGHKFRFKKNGSPYGAHAGGSLLKWIIDNSFPPTIQILCANCNTSKAINGGVCAHMLKKVQRSERQLVPPSGGKRPTPR